MDVELPPGYRMVWLDDPRRIVLQSPDGILGWATDGKPRDGEHWPIAIIGDGISEPQLFTELPPEIMDRHLEKAPPA